MYQVLLDSFANPTKLSIVFLLSHNDKMTVTQMSKHVPVGKPNLYHFVGQMLKDGLLVKPETRVTKNYVEKYYRLSPKAFESIDPAEQRRRLMASRPSELKSYLQSFLAAIGLYFRMYAEEVARADEKTLLQIKESVANQRIMLSHLILADQAYDTAIRELRNTNDNALNEKWPDKGSPARNRLVIVGLPQLGRDGQP